MLTMQNSAFPPVIRTLHALSAILDKAAVHCEAKKVDPAVILGCRLAPDMFALTRQIQIVTDQAKGMAARLAGHDVPAYPDEEQTIGDLKARIAKTVDFMNSLPASAFEGSEDKPVTLKVGGHEMNFTGKDYAFGFVLPNFYFHAATAYDILRHNGVELGKRDFLGI